MRCRRCGWVSRDEETRCSKCSLELVGQTGEIPALQSKSPVSKNEDPSNEEDSSQRSKQSGKLKSNGLAVKLRKYFQKKFWLSNYSFLAKEITARTIIIFTLAVAGLLGIGATALYLVNLRSVNLEVPASAAESHPHLKALMLVQGSRSTIPGKSVKQSVDEFVEKQRLTECYWWSTPDETSGGFNVTFFFIQEQKQDAAIWVADIKSNNFRAANSLAQSFSGQ